MRTTGRRTTRAMATAVTAALALLLASCGSDEGVSQLPGVNAPDNVNEQDDDVLAKISEAAEKAGIDDDDSGGEEDPDGDSIDSGDDEDSDVGEAGAVHPLTWHVPTEGATPAGFQRLPTACDVVDDPDSIERLRWISYAVPETWNVTGRTSGSDSPLSDTTTMSYYEGDGNSHKDYVIEFATDPFEPDQESPNGWTMVDWERKPWTSFDYEYTVGDNVYPIHFDPVATLTVGEQQVEILKAPQEQAPEALSRTEYRARVLLAETPTGPSYQQGQEPPWIPQSSVMSIEYDTESGRAPLTDDMVVDIVSSIAMPECGVEYVVAMRESQLNADINGDGHVTTQAEMVAVLQGEA